MDIEVTFVAPVVVATLSVVTFWVQDWHHDRQRDSRMAQGITQASETVAFFERWLKVQESLRTPEEMIALRRIAQTHLDETYAIVEHQYLSTWRVATEGEFDVDVGQWIRDAFVLYLPHTLIGWIASLLYFIYWVHFLTLAVLWSNDVVATDRTVTDRILVLIVTLVFLGILCLPLMGLRRWALMSRPKPDVATSTLTRSPVVAATPSTSRMTTGASTVDR